MERLEKIQKIVDFIKAGEKDEKNFRLGFEIEHFVVNKDTLESQSFYGHDGVGEILEDLASLGYKKADETGMAFSDGSVDISIEPAGQFELALRAKASVGELFEVYKTHMERLVPIFERRGLLLVALGYHPKSKIDEIKIIPKTRYDFMYKYFEKYGGEFAHNMMKARFFSGFFAISTALPATSMVWVGDPCLLSNSWREKVWMESRTTMSAPVAFISLMARSIEFVERIQRFFGSSFIILCDLDFI